MFMGFFIGVIQTSPDGMCIMFESNEIKKISVVVWKLHSIAKKHWNGLAKYLQ